MFLFYIIWPLSCSWVRTLRPVWAPGRDGPSRKVSWEWRMSSHSFWEYSCWPSCAPSSTLLKNKSRYKISRDYKWKSSNQYKVQAGMDCSEFISHVATWEHGEDAADLGNILEHFQVWESSELRPANESLGVPVKLSGCVLNIGFSVLQNMIWDFLLFVIFRHHPYDISCSYLHSHSCIRHWIYLNITITNVDLVLVMEIRLYSFLLLTRWKEK